MKIVMLLVFTLIVLLDVLNALATLNETAKFINTDGDTDDRFGHAVSIYMNRIVVSSYSEDKDGKWDVGSVGVYKVNGNSVEPTKKLTPRDGEQFDTFGRSIASNRNYIVVGSDGDDEQYSSQGSAYIYHYNGITWVYKKIIARDGARSDYFGCSVGVNDKNVVVIGAKQDRDKGYNSGSAYIFTNNGSDWVQAQKLTPADLTEGSEFGGSVAMTNNRIAFGANRQDYNNVKYSGSVYIYKQSTGNATWYQEAKLRSPNPQAWDYFGVSVSMYGNRVVVGAEGEDLNTGKSYVYVYGVNSTWVLEATLTSTDGENVDYFGCSVAIYQDTVVIGSRGADDKGFNSGSVFVFKLIAGKWEVITKLGASDGKKEDYFGKSVSIFSGDVVVGSSQNEANGKSGGAAYLYKGVTVSTTTTTPQPTATASPQRSTTTTPRTTTTASPQPSTPPQATTTNSPQPTTTAAPKPSTTPQATTTNSPQPPTTEQNTLLITIIVPIVVVAVVIIVAIFWRRRQLYRRQQVEKNVEHAKLTRTFPVEFE